MQWKDVRQTYPDQWLIIEALEAQTVGDQRRIERIAVVETCADGETAFQSYRYLHQQYPLREFYFVHTSRAELEIKERYWIGIRSSHATPADR